MGPAPAQEPTRFSVESIALPQTQGATEGGQSAVATQQQKPDQAPTDSMAPGKGQEVTEGGEGSPKDATASQTQRGHTTFADAATPTQSVSHGQDRPPPSSKA